jgi:serine/threonine protein kinase
MMRWLGDRTLAHLRDVAEWPDLGERYHIVDRLGRGGMGVVYRAHDRLLARDVAVKVLDRALADDAADALLQEEARILARLEHPGIVPVHDAGRLHDGRVFYVMKLIRGRRLDEALDSALSIGDRLSVFLRVCDAVSFAHAAGVIHRDLKPQNIMVGLFGEVLVMDWGIAKIAGAPADSAGRVVGTPGFMAPEQTRGDADIDRRADVFALGGILDELVPPPRPRPLTAIAARAQHADRARRYATVEDLARDITDFRDGLAVSAYRESLTERAARVYRRYRVPILLVLVYMIVRVLLLVYTAGRQ